MDARFDDKIENHVKVEEWRDKKGVSISFGNTSEDEILNKILTILYNLASIKDHLKNCLKGNGYDAKIVEDEINKCLHLQVLFDIVNQEKHGTPLKRSRSNKNPVIRYPSNGYFPYIKNENNEMGSMVISALIKDDKDTKICTLDELVETCYDKWNNLAAKHNIV